MNSDEGSGIEVFTEGETIVLTLEGGRHYLGRFIGYFDDGLAMHVDAKTAYKTVKATDSPFNVLVKNKVEERLSKNKTREDWIEDYRACFHGQKQTLWAEQLPLDQIIAEIKAFITEIFTEETQKIWNGPIQEQDVTKPYLRDMKRSVRTLVMWHKIDEVCSAQEMAEEAEIADLENLLENGEFYKLIEDGEGET